MNDELFDNLMRNKLNGLQPEFDELVWNDLEKRLDKHHTQVYKQVFFRRLRNIAAMLIGAGLLCGVAFMLAPSSDTLLGTTAEPTEQQQQIKKGTKNEKNALQNQENKVHGRKSEQLKATQDKLPTHKQATINESGNTQKNNFDARNLTTEHNFDTKENNTAILQKKYDQPKSVNEEKSLIFTTKNTLLTKQNKHNLPIQLSKLASNTTPKQPPIGQSNARLPLLALKTTEEARIDTYFKKNTGLRIGVGASAEVSKAAVSGRVNGAWNGVASVLLEKNIHQNWRIGAGLNYLQIFQNNNINTTPNVATQFVEVSEQTRINQLIIEKERGTFTQRIEVPLEIKLIIGNHHRWRAFIASGVVFGLNLREKDIYESESVFIDSDTGERIGSSNAFRKTDSRFSGNLDWQINTGIEYSLNSNFHIQLMPYYKYAFSNTQPEQIGNQTFGIRSVLFYSF